MSYAILLKYDREESKYCSDMNKELVRTKEDDEDF